MLAIVSQLSVISLEALALFLVFNVWSTVMETLLSLACESLLSSLSSHLQLLLPSFFCQGASSSISASKGLDSQTALEPLLFSWFHLHLWEAEDTLSVWISDRMLVVDLGMALSWTKASDPQRKRRNLPQARLGGMTRTLLLMWMLAVCAENVHRSFLPLMLTTWSLLLQRSFLLRSAEPTSMFSCMQQPCLPVQLSVTNMVSFQCAAVLPSLDLLCIHVFVFSSSLHTLVSVLGPSHARMHPCIHWHSLLMILKNLNVPSTLRTYIQLSFHISKSP